MFGTILDIVLAVLLIANGALDLVFIHQLHQFRKEQAIADYTSK